MKRASTKNVSGTAKLVVALHRSRNLACLEIGDLTDLPMIAWRWCLAACDWCACSRGHCSRRKL